MTGGSSDKTYRKALGEMAKGVSHWAANLCALNGGLDTAKAFTVPTI